MCVARLRGGRLARDCRAAASTARVGLRLGRALPLLLLAVLLTSFAGRVHGEGFTHQDYTARANRNSFELIKAPDNVDSDRAMRKFLEVIQRRHIDNIWLVHGTFTGEDGFGVLALAADRAPALLNLLGLDGDGLRRLNKSFMDAYDGPDGFNAAFAQELNRRLGTDDLAQARFVWGSENNHLDRAHAAVCMIDALLKLKLPADRNIMLWGHSHAGNVFALVSQLLANDREANQQFFEIGAALYGSDARWINVRQTLAAVAGPHALGKQLYVVTFGTPIRYAWNPAGYRELIHFVHHRPVDESDLQTPAYRTKVLIGLNDVQSARYGDWVQAFAIDGTDSLPLLETRRDANAALAELFGAVPLIPAEEGVLNNLAFWARRVAFLQRSWGIRLPSQGTTLLVDYGPGSEAMFGHAVYLKQAWLPFHAEQIARILSEQADKQP